MAKSVVNNRNKEWVAKMQSQPNLVWLDLSDESSEDRLRVLLNAILQQYTLTYPLIQERLLCARSWVTEKVLCNVPHIFINSRTLACLKDYAEKEDLLSQDYAFPTSYYFFDEIEFEKWIKKNTSADKQTHIVDLGEYSALENFRHLCTEKYNSLSEKKNKEKIRDYEDFIFSSLNEQGQSLFLRKVRSAAKRTGKREAVDIYSIPDDFISHASLRPVFPSLERLCRHVYKVGATKYTIAESLVRYSKKEVFRDIKPYEIVVENI